MDIDLGNGITLGAPPVPWFPSAGGAAVQAAAPEAPVPVPLPMPGLLLGAALLVVAAMKRK